MAAKKKSAKKAPAKKAPAKKAPAKKPPAKKGSTGTAITNAAPTTSVMMVADPSDAPVSVYAEKGNTLEWRNDSPDYPGFEIRFVGESPARKSDKLSGSNAKPVIVHVAKSGKYRYTIRHIKTDGTTQETGPFAVRSCKVC